MPSNQPTVTDFPNELIPMVSSLLAQSGRPEDFQLKPLLGGANNRVFQVQQGADSTVLRWYFSDPHDRRDRSQAEWDFSKFAWQHGLRQIAEPLGLDHRNRLALYAFQSGRRLASTEVDEKYVREAARFYQQLNGYRESESAQQLPLGSEAYFSISKHLECISGRVAMLHQAVAQGSFPEARNFVVSVLLERWQQVQQQVRQQATKQTIDLLAKLPADRRGISPSDFGFHNAMLDADGTLRFFDFEYAGWDDPAKTVCDFFHQVEVPVSKDFISAFIEEMSNDLFDADWLSLRSSLLMPAYRIKWCCIILNPLLPVGNKRRAFSNSEIESDVQVPNELELTEKARQLLESDQ